MSIKICAAEILVIFWRQTIRQFFQRLPFTCYLWRWFQSKMRIKCHILFRLLSQYTGWALFGILMSFLKDEGDIRPLRIWKNLPKDLRKSLLNLSLEIIFKSAVVMLNSITSILILLSTDFSLVLLSLFCLIWLSKHFVNCKFWTVAVIYVSWVCLLFRAGSFLPQPLAAGGGDVVMLAAGVDGRLDFSLAALWGRQRGILVSQCDFPLKSGNATCEETTSHQSTLTQLWGAFEKHRSLFFWMRLFGCHMLMKVPKWKIKSQSTVNQLCTSKTNLPLVRYVQSSPCFLSQM